MRNSRLILLDRTFAVSQEKNLQSTFILKRKSCKSFAWISPFKVSIVTNPAKRTIGTFFTLELAKRMHVSLKLRNK